MNIMNKKTFILTTLLFFIITLGTAAIWTGKSFAGKTFGPENPASLANVIVVAKSSGDFDSIQDAIDSITPTADKPYLVEVMPGTYVEDNPIQMKDFVHLSGSGADVTTIQETFSDDIFILNGLTNVKISGFTFESTYEVFWNIASAPTIQDNTFVLADGAWGIWSAATSSPTIIGNTFKGASSCIQPCGTALGNENSSAVINGNIMKWLETGIDNRYSSDIVIAGNMMSDFRNNGIANKNSTSIKIMGNRISSNVEGSKANAIWSDRNSSSTISGNVISGFTGNHAVYIRSGDTVINNKITGNTMTDSYRDIYFYSDATINFNVFDSYNGTLSGSFNVKSDGTPW